MRNMIKKICGIALATVLSVSSMIVSMPINVFAAEAPKLPSIDKFASPNDLRSAKNFTLYTGNGSGSAQKVDFGGKTWYIAGADSDGSLILISNPGEYGSKPFDSDSVTYTYSSSEIRDYLRGDAFLDNFKTEELNLIMEPSINTSGSATTSDKFYLASGEDWANEITVGMNNTKIGLYENGPSGSPFVNSLLGASGEFWLRSPHSMGFTGIGLVAYTGGYQGNTGAIRNMGVSNTQAVVPACDLDMSKVLFASTATAASASPTLFGEKMFLRIANDGQFESTAEVNGQTISVTYDGSDSDVYLYVQGNDGGNWVTAVLIDSTREYTLEDLGRYPSDDLSKCQVWLEKNIGGHRLTYATYAVGGNHKGGSGNGGSGNGGSGNGGSGYDDSDNDDSNDSSCDHDFQWQTITAPTATTYGTEGEVCSKCGATRNVRAKSPIDDWVRMQINNAKPGDVLTLNFGPWNSFPLWMMQMIADKPTVTYVFKYTYQGNKYEVTIKPGDKFPLDCEWYGPAKMPTLFDTVITKW